VTPDEPKSHHGAFIFHTNTTIFENSNVTSCNAIEDTFGSIFAAHIEGVTARRGIFLDSGGVYIAAVASIIVEECVMIAQGVLCPCRTYEDALCEFRFCEFHGAVIFRSNGSIEGCKFHAPNHKIYANGRLDQKGELQVGTNYRVVRLSLSDLRSCPRNGAYFIHQSGEKDYVGDAVTGDSDARIERGGHWVWNTILVLDVGLLVFLV
jgi:hypothetical protein